MARKGIWSLRLLATIVPLNSPVALGTVYFEKPSPREAKRCHQTARPSQDGTWKRTDGTGVALHYLIHLIMREH
jgi:hypothetical protein